MEGTWLDAVTGKIARAGGAQAELTLALPYESRVLLFSKERAAEAPLPAATETTALDLSTGWKVTFPAPRPWRCRS